MKPDNIFIDTQRETFNQRTQYIVYVIVASVWILLLVKNSWIYLDQSFSLLDALELFFILTFFPFVILYSQHQIRHHLKNQKEEYKVLFEMNPNAMWIYDVATLKFLMVNKSACVLYGYTKDEFLSMKVSEIRPPDDVPALLEEISKNGDEEYFYHWSGRWRHKTKSGEMIYAEVSSHKLNFNGRKASLVLSYDITDKVMQEIKLQTINQELEQKVDARTYDFLLLNNKLVEQNTVIRAANLDLTRLSDELKKANEKIKEHSELKNRFVTMVSHEFRTPLSTIRFSAEYISRYHKRITMDQILEKVDGISKQIVHMDAMLSGVLTVGKTDTIKIKVVTEAVDVRELLKSIVKDVHQSTNFTHDIRIELGDIPPVIHTDEKLLRNIFNNLLTNAIKYSPDNKNILFTVVAENNELCFKVRDYGMGVENDDINKIFEPFYRTENTKHIQGTGLGLSIVKRAVDLIDGRISVSSAPGMGAEFSIWLPVKKDEVLSHVMLGK